MKERVVRGIGNGKDESGEETEGGRGMKEEKDGER